MTFAMVRSSPLRDVRYVRIDQQRGGPNDIGLETLHYILARSKVPVDIHEIARSAQDRERAVRRHRQDVRFGQGQSVGTGVSGKIDLLDAGHDPVVDGGEVE